jgi:hypothetical protein
MSLAELGITMDGALVAVCFGAMLCEPRLRRMEAIRCVENAYRKGAKDGHRAGLGCV